MDDLIELIHRTGSIRRPPSNYYLQVCDWILDRVSDGQPDQIAALIDRLDISRSHADYLIGVLSWSFAIRERIPNWVQMVERVRIELRRRGINDTMELTGLWEREGIA